MGAETAASRAIAQTHKKEFARSRAGHIADKMWEAVVSRDQGLAKFGETHQSLATYNQWGKVEEDPITQEFAKSQKDTLIAEVREQILGMSQHEMDVMTMVVPRLVDAIVLDKRYVTKIYEQDFQSIFRTALDWFAHPDAIDQTHIRIGFGGEEQVGSRVPAYVAAGVETLRRVREVMGVHGNWAIHNAVQNRIPEQDRQQADQMLVEMIRMRTGELYNDDGTPFSDRDYLNQIQNPTQIDVHAMRVVMKNFWQMYGKGNLDEVKRAYHFTDKLPKLVIFNGANAAIEIDKMDHDKVHSMRNQTQRLIREYVATFHPAFEESLIFQNDTEWENHTDITRLMMHYLLELIHASNGERTKVSEKLHQFGQHHQRDQHAEVMGATPSEVYAMLHRDFFDDPFEAEGSNRPYPTNVMDGLIPPRNVIWRQGQPEIAFGAIRKVVSTEATMSGFIQWMQRREAALENNYASLATDIADQAWDLSDSYKGDKPRDFASFIQEILNKAGKKPGTEPIPTAATSLFRSVLASERFAHTTSSVEQYALWDEFVRRIGTPILFATLNETPSDDHEAREKQMKYEAQQLRGFVDHMQFHVTMMDEHTERMNSAIQEGDEEKIIEEATTPEALLGLTTNRVETISAVGELPVYYVTDSDAIVWPDGQIPRLHRYEEAVAEIATKAKRIKGTVGYVAGRIQEFVQLDPEVNNDPALVENCLTKVGDHIRNLLSEVDIYEVGGASKEVIDDLINQQVHKLRSLVKGELQNAVPEVYTIVSNAYSTEVAVDVAKANLALSDYHALLRDVDPAIADLEQEREQLLIQMQGLKNGEKAKFRDTVLAEQEGRLRQARLAAEEKYIELLQKTFPADTNSPNLSENGKIHAAHQVVGAN